MAKVAWRWVHGRATQSLLLIHKEAAGVANDMTNTFYLNSSRVRRSTGGGKTKTEAEHRCERLFIQVFLNFLPRHHFQLLPTSIIIPFNLIFHPIIAILLPRSRRGRR
jgi:hypothetical protein